MFESKLQCCCCWWWWWFFLGVLSLFVYNCLHCILILLGCWLVSRVAVSCLESILSLSVSIPRIAFWSCLVVDESFLLLVLARSPYSLSLSLSLYNLHCILILLRSWWVFLGIWNLDYLVCRFAVLAAGSFEGSWGCIVSGSKFWVHHLAVVCCWETFQRFPKSQEKKSFEVQELYVIFVWDVQVRCSLSVPWVWELPASSEMLWEFGNFVCSVMFVFDRGRDRLKPQSSLDAMLQGGAIWSAIWSAASRVYIHMKSFHSLQYRILTHHCLPSDLQLQGVYYMKNFQLSSI